ncbi:endo alpha-1,4 polygalactosaminidase [Streptomyces sp. NPDC048479]|uniref:endo alpha-1,4 polygalactosaminidase n=1 Tax=Streptomyces sp. NPDC048479 TaxID=3154725 RepID=UPI00342FBDBE
MRVGVTVGVVGALGAGALWFGASAVTGVGSKAPAPQAAGTKKVTLPPANAPFDYQIGGAYKPAAGVKVVVRDRSDSPAAGLYNICYVNAFQAQPEELSWWKSKHNDLLLKDAQGRNVVDGGWDEALLDISTTGKRKRLAAIVGGWIDGCAKSGFKGVEPDNFDSYDRSGGRLTKSHASAFAKLLAERAHAKGLAIAQKNTADLLTESKRNGFDFAVAEECGRWNECDDYTARYGDRVFVIEYRKQDFSRACSTWGGKLSIVQRDLQVHEPTESGYVRKAC